MRSVQIQSYVLVNRPYSESSLIVELFTRSFGRHAVLAKGARRFKSKLRGYLLPFQPVLVSWAGKGELPTLTHVDIDPTSFQGWHQEMTGKARVCAFYCNELISALVQRGDPHERVFDLYAETLSTLLHMSETDSVNEEGLYDSLRMFELGLIRDCGYGVNFLTDASTNKVLDEHGAYQFLPGRGFVQESNSQRSADNIERFSGRIIRSLVDAQLKDVSLTERNAVKRLMRLIMGDVLNYKRIVSRELFYPTSG